MTLGKRIQELRKKAGLSQEALGEALGVSRQAVSKWESDGGVPELDTLIAMSRLFGVTLGELLGIETPPAAPVREADVESSAREAEAEQGVSPEQLEEILRRYTEEVNSQPPRRRTLTFRQRAAIILAAAVVFGAAAMIRSAYSTLKHRIGNLEDQLLQLEMTMDDRNVYLTERIAEILEEQNALLSSQGLTVVDFDPAAETVTVELSAALKTFVPATQAKFLCLWTLEDGSTGQTESEWAEGPDFRAQVEIPMNIQLDLSLRLRDGEGVIQEVPMESRLGLSAENFVLDACNLTALFAVSIDHGDWATVTAEDPAISVSTHFPQLYVPETARLTARVNGETVCDWELELTPQGTEGLYEARHPEQATLDLTLKEGDALTVTLTATDSLGRSYTFTEGLTATETGLEKLPMSEEALREEMGLD